jgi:hypothetical protein
MYSPQSSVPIDQLSTQLRTQVAETIMLTLMNGQQDMEVVSDDNSSLPTPSDIYEPPSHIISPMSKISNLHLPRLCASKHRPCIRRARRRLRSSSRRSRSPNMMMSSALSFSRRRASLIWVTKSLVQSLGAPPESGALSSPSQRLCQTPRTTSVLMLDKSAWCRMELPSHQLHLSIFSRYRCPKIYLLTWTRIPRSLHLRTTLNLPALHPLCLPSTPKFYLSWAPRQITSRDCLHTTTRITMMTCLPSSTHPRMKGICNGLLLDPSDNLKLPRWRM